jgi:hypothetical protein
VRKRNQPDDGCGYGIEPKRSYPRQVTARCGHSVRAWNQREADRLRDGHCRKCALDKMRAYEQRDRRPL